MRQTASTDGQAVMDLGGSATVRRATSARAKVARELTQAETVAVEVRAAVTDAPVPTVNGSAAYPAICKQCGRPMQGKCGWHK